MINEEIVEYFSKNCDDRGIPEISFDGWQNLITTYEKDDIRNALAEYVHRNNIPFPIKRIHKDDFGNLFIRFCMKSHLPLYKEFDDVQERYDYKYKYSDKPLGVIDKTHAFNDVSDYFQQENRMKCGSNASLAPMEIWNDKDNLSRMNWIFWRNGVMEDSGVNEKTFRSSFRLGTYTATQFKPSVAKAIYEKHEAVNVLDTSCGWGDRLAGFYATLTTKLYVGCDPNPEVFEVYKKQCVAYEELLGATPVLTESEDYFECVGKKTVKIWRKPCEDVNWDLYINTFDLYFTSPPYFDTETYGTTTDKTEDQSWSRYNSFDAWKYNFFFKVTDLVWKTIKSDGYMMINIIEPRSRRGVRLKLCDDMVETFESFEGSNYIGKIGMRMVARPNTQELNSVFIEPVWVFRKNNSSYIDDDKLTIEDFLN